MTLRDAPGIASLLKIRKLEELEVSGQDRVQDGSDTGRLEDINHKEAIGPMMMRIMLSRAAYERRFGVE